MGKSTLVLILIAGLGLGALIGASIAGKEPAELVENAPTAVASTGGAPVYRFIAPGDLAIEPDEFGRAKPSTVGENYIRREGEPKSETVTIDLELDGAIEYKVMMQQGDAITFSWTTDNGEAYYDFHAHDDAFGDEFFTRYEEGETGQLSGSIVAPYTGQHGWYWLNLNDGPTTITLQVAGFYDEIVRIDLGGY